MHDVAFPQKTASTSFTDFKKNQPNKKKTPPKNPKTAKMLAGATLQIKPVEAAGGLKNLNLQATTSKRAPCDFKNPW